MSLPKNISGSLIKKARVAQNICLASLSSKCAKHNLKISVQELQKIEDQQRGVNDIMLEGIAKALEVSVTSLLFENTNKQEWH